MVLDFDVKIYCQNLKATKPPYECPVKDCGKVYKSYNGIQFHLYTYDHLNPENGTPGKTPNSRKIRGRWHHRSNRRSPTPPEFLVTNSTRETLTYAEAQRLVEIDLEGKIHRINIYEPLEIICQDELDNVDNTEKEECPEKLVKKVEMKDAQKLPMKENATPNVPPNQIKLPEASYKIISNYVKPAELPTPKRSLSYFRYMERSVDEMDDEVEYDMDEEDHAWLELVNTERKDESLSEISQETFEVLMDRFEKEAFFQSQTTGKDTSPSIDEDAVCSICMDGECQNSNVILFCDMCNLPVHQECYGVPYIPEGQWLCRRCLQSPSRAVDCSLCPNKGGAFKQTDDGRWAHVVCALWIPEVGFANTVFLEPIDGIEHIPPARWRLTCYICKQKGTGACIQCHKTNCYTAFHVTCAQQAGLFMKIEPIRETGINGTSVSVRKTAFCDVHSPADALNHPMIDNGEHSDSQHKSLSPDEAKAKARQKMRLARKILAEKRNAVPVVSIPVIPEQRLSKISAKIVLPKKTQFLGRMQSYWTLKRQSRNGVPLLRRLQSNHMTRNRDQMKNDQESKALKAQLKYWQRLRQDLEKARLLVELIRKREKLKKEQLRIHQLATEIQLQPFVFLLRHTLEQIVEKDSGHIFSEPVSLSEVPDYNEFIQHPMDFSTMKVKLENHEYKTLDAFEADFDLVLNNCLTYNAKDTTYYRAAIKLRDQGGAIIRAARRMAEKVGYDPETGLHLNTPPRSSNTEPLILEEVDRFLSFEKRDSIPLEEQLKVLLDKLDMANIAKLNKRSRIAKQIRREIVKVRKQLALQKGQSFTSDMEDFRAEDTADTASSDDSSELTRRRKLPSPLRLPTGDVTTARTPSTPRTPLHSGRGRGRGRPGRPRKQPNMRSPDAEPAVGSATPGDGPDITDPQSAGEPAKAKPQPPTSSSPTPTGVNRRTSVLFSKKARKSLPSPGTPDQPRRGPGRPPKPKPPLVAPSTPQDTSDNRQPKDEASTPAPTTSRKRAASLSNVDSSPCQPNPKRSQPEPAPSVTDTEPEPDPELDFFNPRHRESFFRYRSTAQPNSDIDTGSESGSSDSFLSDSDSREDSSSESMDGDARTGRYLRRVRTKSRNYDSDDEGDDDVIPLEPLDLVWAKCRGYPWYPALIINPKMPKTGYFHNGVPIPVPPEDVLALQRKHDQPVYLVLFFDAKRTWQWLPRNKLEPLGVDSGLDKAKLLQSKKPNIRKAVTGAYDKAILHRCRVTGEQNPMQMDLGTDE